MASPKQRNPGEPIPANFDPNMGMGTTPPIYKNPIEDLYKSELGRAPDAGGLEFWTNAYNNGMSLDDIRDQGFRASQEYINRQATTPPDYPYVQPDYTRPPLPTPPEVYNPFNGPGNPPEYRNPVEDLYQTELGRAADPGGLEFWTNAYNNGMSLDDIRDQGFRASQEYINRQATPQPAVYPEGYDPITGTIIDQQPARKPRVTGGPFPDRTQEGYPFSQTLPGFGTPPQDILDAYKVQRSPFAGSVSNSPTNYPNYPNLPFVNNPVNTTREEDIFPKTPRSSGSSLAGLDLLSSLFRNRPR